MRKLVEVLPYSSPYSTDYIPRERGTVAIMGNVVYLWCLMANSPLHGRTFNSGGLLTLMAYWPSDVPLYYDQIRETILIWIAYRQHYLSGVNDMPERVLEDFNRTSSSFDDEEQP